MRRLIVAAAFLLAATTAHAAPVWTQPGWYQVADTIVGPFVWAGPFADELDCEEVLPPNEADADYMCEYLNERPEWDE
jgi:hypothetical protein